MANYTTPIILDIISVIQQGSTMWLTNSKNNGLLCVVLFLLFLIY